MFNRMGIGAGRALRVLAIAVGVGVVASGPTSADSYEIGGTVPADQSAAEILSEIVVCKQPNRYIGWPDLVYTPAGDLLAVFSGDRDWHVDPWGKVMAVRSSDGGKTWGSAELVIDTPLDDRGTGIEVLSDGALYVSFEAALTFATRSGPRYDPYKEHAATLTPEVRREWKGFWGLRSDDNGRTWAPRVKMPAMTPHGPTALKDGRLLLPGGGPIYESRDNGATWGILATLEKDPNTWTSGNAFLSEAHIVEAADGRILLLSRYHDRAKGDRILRQFESADGGRTWSGPTKTGMDGYPVQLLQLENGWLVAVYGRRVAPMGQRACISKDHGRTWLVDQEIVLSNAVEIDTENPSWDLGYPSSAQLPNGSIWTVYYQVEKKEDGEFPSLMATHWRVRE